MHFKLTTKLATKVLVLYRSPMSLSSERTLKNAKSEIAGSSPVGRPILISEAKASKKGSSAFRAWKETRAMS